MGSIAARRPRTASSLSRLRPARAQRQPSGTLGGEVLRREATGEAGRAEEHEVEGAVVVCHEVDSASLDDRVREPVRPCDRPTGVRHHLQQAAVVAVTAGITASVAMGPGSSSAPVGSGAPSSPALEPVAAALAPYAGCDALRQSYVDAALPRVGPWGFDLPSTRCATPPRRRRHRRRQNTATGTNVQEAGRGRARPREDRRRARRPGARAPPRRRRRHRDPAASALALRLPGPWLDRHEVLLVDDIALVAR